MSHRASGTGSLSFAFAAAALLATTSARVADAGILAHFTGNDTPNDSAGGMTAQLIGGAGYGAGVAGNAFSFVQGSPGNQWVQSDAFPAWSIAGGDFTISAWANFDSIAEGPDGQLPNVFVGVDESAGFFNKWVFYFNGSRPGFHVNGTDFKFLTSPNAPPVRIGRWHHWALTRTADDFEFYFDGASLGIVTDATIVPPNIQDFLTIGKAEFLGYVNGRIDDVQIYDHSVGAAGIQFLFEHPGQEVGAPCIGDLNHDGTVSGLDITIVLANWGPCGGCEADINGDGTVNGFEITLLLSNWGPCGD